MNFLENIYFIHFTTTNNEDKTDLSKKIVNISFYADTRFNHIFVSENKPFIQNKNVIIAYDEKHAVAVLAELLNQTTIIANDKYFPNIRLAGWELYLKYWPLFVNKCIKYSIPLLNPYKINILDTYFEKIKNLIDLSLIYTQGVYSIHRPLPNFYHFAHYLNLAPKETIDDLEKIHLDDLCVQNPEIAINYIEKILTWQVDLFKRYYIENNLLK